MSTVANVLSDAAAAVASLISGATRASSDYARDRDVVGAGETIYQLRGWHLGKDNSNANTSYDVARIELTVATGLASPTNERAYTEAAMLTQQDAVLAASWWRALASVYYTDPDNPPALTDDVARVGNVIVWTMAVELLVQP